jgi:hypothetical protein
VGVGQVLGDDAGGEKMGNWGELGGTQWNSSGEVSSGPQRSYEAYSVIGIQSIVVYSLLDFLSIFFWGLRGLLTLNKSLRRTF